MLPLKSILFLGLFFTHLTVFAQSSQFQLVSPNNYEKVNGLTQFVWLPGGPMGMTESNVRITEVHVNQTPEAAILNNPLVFESQSVSGNSFSSSVSFMNLEAGKKYAWQVVSYEKRPEQPVVKRFSTVGVFQMESAKPQNAPKPMTYFQLERKISGRTFELYDDSLRYTFREYYPEMNVQMNIVNQNNQQTISWTEHFDDTIEYRSYDVSQLPAGLYTVIAWVNKKEKFLCRFRKN